MEIKKEEGPPEEGDVVLATVVRVAPHAAFIELNNYPGVEGLIHISEISKSWVKNIKTHFRDNQKIICKVVEVKKPDFIHASIRRVSDYDRRAKWDQIKRQRRAESIIEVIARRTDRGPEEVYELLKPLEEEHGELYFAFEEAKKQGKEFFEGIPDIADAVWKVIDKRISLPSVEIKGELVVESTAGDGVERIGAMFKGLDAGVTYLGAPRYRLSVEAVDYKEAERKLEKILKKLRKKAGKTETVSFERRK